MKDNLPPMLVKRLKKIMARAERIHKERRKDIELTALRKKDQEQNGKIFILNKQIHYVIDRITCKEIHSFIPDKYGNYIKTIDFRKL